MCVCVSESGEVVLGPMARTLPLLFGELSKQQTVLVWDL